MIRFWGMWALVFVLSSTAARAQTDGLQQLDDAVQVFLQQQHTLGHLPDAFLRQQPLSVEAAQAYLDSLAALDSAQTVLAPASRRRLQCLRGLCSNPRARWLNNRVGWLYENGRDLVSASGDGYALQLNPLMYATYQPAQVSGAAGAPSAIWRNTRGVRVSGHIGEHLFFESRLTENQEQRVRPNFSSTGREGTAPRQGFVLRPAPNTLDYTGATGVVGFRSRFFEVRFGQSRNRWSTGPGSLFLSDYATNYTHLQLRTTVGPVQYTNLFARFVDGDRLAPQGNRVDAIQPRRYGAFHRLSINITDRLNVGLFESVIFAPEQDSTVSRTGFDLAYLNPIIFYRAVERDLGSPDNAMIGVDASWIVTPGVQVYGQMLLDELLAKYIGDGWWSNKWGFMAGVHYVPPQWPAFSARIEWARQRPYLGAHRFAGNGFAHWSDYLGHPAGPNSIDYAVFLKYRPAGPWQAGLNLSYTRRGRNTATQNFGSDPTVPSTTRARDFGVDILQGVRQARWIVEGHVGYEVLPGFFAEATLQAQGIDDAAEGVTRWVAPGLALRWGLPFGSIRY
ncbi:hypothetical protein [Salisaeta longa]|uniref:hypothetical protein n=1 Tax=Salisaeta longa TaxID=503170 RepID=UPI0004266346|nr:hypothetical protein [Salisaeta longa]